MMNELQIEQWPLGRLNPYENNPRKNDHAVARMVEVMREFGFRVPVLARSDGELIDGHLRYKAAMVMELPTVPVIVVDDMSPAQVRAFRIMINRSATWADWDEDALLRELRALQLCEFDLSLTGFDTDELDDMLMSLDDEGKNPDEIPPLPESALTKDGEIWILGRHRLMCGDSTSPADMQRLMDGGLADMVWTDPPYNVDYQGAAGKIRNDKMTPQKFEEFMLLAHRVMHETLRPGGAIYVAHSEAGDGMVFRRAFMAAGFKLAACLIWRKQSAVLSRGDYHFQHEPILYVWKRGAAHRWYGNRKQRTVFEVNIPELQEVENGIWQLCLDGKVYQISGEAICIEELATSVISEPKPMRSELHPTTKPVALVERMVANSSPRGGCVLDSFGGSGTTLVACERLGRAARVMEIDPRFADVIILRWQEYTGGIATRQSDGATFDEISAA
ncbi:MAG: DNA modification methylase [Desulfovibrio sp.]